MAVSSVSSRSLPLVLKRVLQVNAPALQDKGHVETREVLDGLVGPTCVICSLAVK